MTEYIEYGLTPEQAADVIVYFRDDAEAHAREWDDKIALAQAAIRTIRERYSLLPSGEPMLTPKEMDRGLDYIDGK
jgi:hypothetical protein